MNGDGESVTPSTRPSRQKSGAIGVLALLILGHNILSPHKSLMPEHLRVVKEQPHLSTSREHGWVISREHRRS